MSLHFFFVIFNSHCDQLPFTYLLGRHSRAASIRIDARWPDQACERAMQNLKFYKCKWNCLNQRQPRRTCSRVTDKFTVPRTHENWLAREKEGGEEKLSHSCSRAKKSCIHHSLIEFASLLSDDLHTKIWCERLRAKKSMTKKLPILRKSRSVAVNFMLHIKMSEWH